MRSMNGSPRARRRLGLIDRAELYAAAHDLPFPSRAGRTAGPDATPPSTLDPTSSPRRRSRVRGALGTGLVLAALGLGGLYTLNKYTGFPPYENNTAAVEQVDHQSKQKSQMEETAPPPVKQPTPQFDDAFNQRLENLLSNHQVKYVVDKEDKSTIYAVVNAPQKDPFSPCGTKKYDSLSNIVTSIFGKEGIGQHKGHLSTLIDSNRSLVGNCPQLVYPGNEINVTSLLTDKEICDPPLGQYLKDHSLDAKPQTPEQVLQANQKRMGYKGACNVNEHATPCAPGQKSAGTHSPAVAAKKPAQSLRETSPCPPDMERKLQDVSKDFDSTLAPRYDTVVQNLERVTTLFQQKYNDAKKDGLTSEEKTELRKMYDMANAPRTLATSAIRKLSAIYQYYVDCNHENDLVAEYVKGYIDEIPALFQTLDDLMHTIDNAPTVTPKPAATPNLVEADRPTTPAERNVIRETPASAPHVLIGKDKKAMVDLVTALVQARKAANNQGMPIIVYDEKVSFYAKRTDGQKLELHTVGISPTSNNDTLTIGPEFVFKHNGKYQKKPGDHDAYHLNDTISGKHAKILGIDVPVHFKTNFAPDVKYPVSLYPSGTTYTKAMGGGDISPPILRTTDHVTMKADFALPNLVALTTADDKPLAYLAIVPHKTFGDYLRGAILDAALFSAGGFVVDYFNLDFVKPFVQPVTQGPPIPHPRN